MPFRKRAWLTQAFKDGMNSQRSHTRTQLRKDVHHIILEGILASRVATQQSRIQHFIASIPRLAPAESSQIFTCIIHGSVSADGVMQGISCLPPANTMQRIHNIEYTTPGAIVDSSIWSLWLFSGNEDFLPTGDFTAINYRDHHDE
ncbi:hypothetical protein K438DRAFT_1976818 [Mycena galopus ATCC 62051]|nr:hypothetical protein K438DRAFT_1976818 [Mycena galopus ATCC 62051]